MSRFALTTGRVTSIVFNDGGMNVLSSEALRELRMTIGQIPAWTRLLLFRSGSSRIFAAGADMREMSRFSAADAGRFSESGQSVFDSIERLPMTTVVFIDGDCFGGALDLALSFDVILATPGSRFSHPGGRIGIVTGFGGTSRWRGRLSGGAAGRLFLGNSILSAALAMEIDLVDELAEREELDLWLSGAATRSAGIPRWIPPLFRASDRSDQQLLLLARRASDLYSLAKLEEGDAARR
jgi:enoyl-CoA hydratase